MDEKFQKKKKDLTKRKRSFKNQLRRILLFLVLCLIVMGGYYYSCNNISFKSDKAFERSLDNAIENAIGWIDNHQEHLVRKQPNMALLRMIKECDKMSPNPLFEKILEDYMALNSRPFCWRAVLDPNWPVDRLEVNITLKKENIDNQWVLFAVAPDKVEMNAEQLQIFDPDKWHGRQLTHQLSALVQYKEYGGDYEKLDELIEHLCGRIAKQLTYKMPVTDIYIQRVTFILRAGQPEKIRRKWIERIITHQRDDGGWNDQWFCFRSRKKPVFEKMPTHRHPTVQALWLMYLVKYKYHNAFISAWLEKDGEIIEPHFDMDQSKSFAGETGDYTLHAEYPGYKTIQQKVTIKSKEKSNTQQVLEPIVITMSL